MSKTRSKIKLCIVAILTIIGLLLTFVSFVIPTTNTTFRGFFNAINYGYDIAGGRLVTFSADKTGLTEEEFSSRLDDTVMRYNSTFSSMGFNITRQGDTIRIEVSKFDDEEVSNLVYSGGSSVDIFSLMASDKGISINTDSSKYDAEGSITTEYIKDCTLGKSQADGSGGSVYPVSINFTEEGQKLLKKMTTPTSDSAVKLYMYLNGTNYNSSGFEVSNAVSSLTLYAGNEKAATSLYLQISALAKPLNLTTIVNQNVSSGLSTGIGGFFGNVSTLILVAFALILVAVIVFLSIRYRMLGLLGIMSIAMFVSIYAFLLQSIPLVLIDLNGLLGVALTFVLLVMSIIEIFERVRYEYSLGKKIPNSVTSAFKKKTLTVLEKYVVLLIVSVVMYLVGMPALKTLAVALFVGLFVNYFILFVVLKGTCLSYININSTKKKFYNLKREGIKNEV